MTPIDPDDHARPRPRNARREVEGRTYLFKQPLLVHDPESLLELCDQIIADPQVAKRYMPRTKARNAVAAASIAEGLRSDFEARRLSDNTELKARIGKLEAERTVLAEKAELLSSSLAVRLAPLGVSLDTSKESLSFGDDEPVSQSALAGRHMTTVSQLMRGLPLLKLLAALVGGAAVGINLGLVTDTIQLSDIGREWPILLLWVSIGVVLMLLTGTSLFTLATKGGAAVFWSRMRNGRCWIAAAVEAMLLLALLASVIVVTESTVERTGLFKALTESQSLTSVKLSQTDLMMVSLLMVLPVVAFYVVTGIIYGDTLAKQTFLSCELEKERKAVRETEAFSLAAGEFQVLRSLLNRIASLDAAIAEWRAKVRDGLTTTERELLHDAASDAFGASWELERTIYEHLDSESAVAVSAPKAPWQRFAFWKVNR
ncbi:MAG: hypothetical protein U0R49_11490 [Fimbriimonadales bacterium]